jgi:hypothetical protein
MTVLRELSKYTLDLVGLQVGSGTESAEEYTFCYGKGNKKHEYGIGFLYVSESYQQIRGLSLLVIGCHTAY